MGDFPVFVVPAHCSGHRWFVFSTALEEVCLLLACGECGRVAIVRDPSREEWRRAFYAPENPYLWDGDPGRVEILPEEQQPKQWGAPAPAPRPQPALTSRPRGKVKRRRRRR